MAVNRAKSLSLVVALGILALSGVVALRLHGPAPVKAEDDEKAGDRPPVHVVVAVAHSGLLAEALRVSGTLQPLPNGQSRVAAQVAGRLESVLVAPGQTVRAGQLLATVSRPDLGALARQASSTVREATQELAALRAERRTRAAALPLLERRAQADLSAAQARLALVRAGSRPEEIQRAEAGVQTARADLDRLRAGARPQEVAQAEAAVRDARSEVAAQTKNAARKRALLAQGIVAARDAERAEADLTTAQSNLEVKEQALSLVRAGTRPEEIRAQESRVSEAEAALRQAKAGARPQEVAEAQAAVAAAQTQVEQAKAARDELRALDQRLRGAQEHVQGTREQAGAAASTASRVELRAPIAGVVSQVFASAGSGVAEQTPVVEILNRDAFRAVLDIPAASGARVRPGMRAEITVPSLPGVVLGGSVRTLLATANAETGLIPAEVWVADPRHRLAEGMAVTARLLVPRHDTRLFVPTQAVYSREGERFVYVIQGDTVHEQPVDVGAEQGEETEVRKGLRAGDRVVRDGSLSLAEGTKVSGDGIQEVPAVKDADDAEKKTAP
jgi:HlyD family secretion protein